VRLTLFGLCGSSSLRGGAQLGCGQTVKGGACAMYERSEALDWQTAPQLHCVPFREEEQHEEGQKAAAGPGKRIRRLANRPVQLIRTGERKPAAAPATEARADGRLPPARGAGEGVDLPTGSASDLDAPSGGGGECGACRVRRVAPRIAATAVGASRRPGVSGEGWPDAPASWQAAVQASWAPPWRARLPAGA
jgi:hypothetical protein